MGDRTAPVVLGCPLNLQGEARRGQLHTGEWYSREKSKLRYKFGILQHMGGFSVTKPNEIIKGVSVERAEKRRMMIPGTLQHSEARKGTEQSGAEIPGTRHPGRQGKSISWRKGAGRCRGRSSGRGGLGSGRGIWRPGGLSALNGHGFSRDRRSISRSGKRLTAVGLRENGRGGPGSQERQLLPEVLQQNKAEK